MRIVLVSCVYPPEPVVSAQTSVGIAKSLTKQGVDVSIITAFPNRPAGRIFSGYQRKFIQKEFGDCGYKVIRCFATLSPKSTLASRFLENISFGIVSGLVALCIKRPDVIYANTWPVFATGILMLIANIRRIPVVLSIQDIYPESLTTQDRLSTDSNIFRIIRRIDNWIAHQAWAIIVISEHFANIYHQNRKTPSENIYIIPNWVADQNIDDGLNQHLDTRKKYQIPESDFLAVYGGNVGVAAGVDTVIKAIGLTSPNDGIQFLVAGEGSQLNTCQILAKETAPSAIYFHHPWLPNETSTILKSADVLILPTRGKQSLVSVPSKLITYMFASRPVIVLANEDSEIARIVKRANCGWIIDPDRPQQLAKLLEEVKLLKQDDLRKLGESGYQFAVEHFSSEANVAKVIKILQEAAQLHKDVGKAI